MTSSFLVFVFHTISENTVFNAVSPKKFCQFIFYLVKNNFNVIPLNELSNNLRNGHVKPRTVSITFDDGYLDTYKIALPILTEFNIPATVFIETAKIGGDAENQGKMFPMMHWKHLEMLHETVLVELEPHTVNHPRLTLISDEKIMKEVDDSKQLIENRLHKTCTQFAYPYGLNDERVQLLVASLGFVNAYTTENKLATADTNPYAIPRINMNKEINLNKFIEISQSIVE